MSGFVEIKKRMESVEMISKMTRAMQLISGVRMRQAKRLLAEALPFSVHCMRTMDRLLSMSPELKSPYMRFREKNPGDKWKLDVFILTGDRGFDGTYNADVVAASQATLERRVRAIEEKGYIPDITLHLTGTRGRDELRAFGWTIDESFYYSLKEPQYLPAVELAEQIQLDYQAREIDETLLIYSMMTSPISSVPIDIRLLPADLPGLRKVIDIACDDPDVKVALPPGFPGEPPTTPFEFAGDVDMLLDYLFNTYLSGVVYGALVEAYASEQTARMTSMDNASRNSAELMTTLLHRRNRLRQNEITSELTEMSASVEAMRYIDSAIQVEKKNSCAGVD